MQAVPLAYCVRSDPNSSSGRTGLWTGLEPHRGCSLATPDTTEGKLGKHRGEVKSLLLPGGYNSPIMGWSNPVWCSRNGTKNVTMEARSPHDVLNFGNTFAGISPRHTVAKSSLMFLAAKQGATNLHPFEGWRPIAHVAYQLLWVTSVSPIRLPQNSWRRQIQIFNVFNLWNGLSSLPELARLRSRSSCCSSSCAFSDSSSSGTFFSVRRWMDGWAKPPMIFHTCS